MSNVPTDLASLSLEEKIGQMLCLGWGGADSRANINAQARECVTELHAGGMIVMGRNVQPQVRPLPPIDVPAVRAMFDELQSLAKIPLVVPTDHEGGRVARLRAPLTIFPSAKVIGDTGNTKLAHDVARAMGNELLQIGINVNFAPVADVNSNPLNPIIGDRSFGSTPGIVAEMVTAQIHGYRDSGVFPCAKHFPGHGDTAQDSHHDLPSLTFSLAEMETRELLPFHAAIAAEIPFIMTAHIVFPALDSELPATLSHNILTGLLREKLGFNGLIVTDCLEMKAIADHWGTAKAALLAAKAGADILLVCHTLERQRETYHTLLEAAKSGELPESRINDAVSRILATKQKLSQFPPLDLSILGNPAHQAVADALITTPFEHDTPTTLGAEAPP